MRSRFLLIATGVVSLLAACEEPMCGCPPELEALNGVISGYVFTPDSVALPGAAIEAQSGVGSCDNADERLSTYTGPADINGYYGASVISYEHVENVCLRARALPPDGSAFSPSDWVELLVDEEENGMLVGHLEQDLYLEP